MPSLGDAYDEAADAWARRRLYLGATLLFVGAVVAAPGLVAVTAGVLEAVGVGPAAALSLGVAVAGLAIPLVGFSLLQFVPAGPRSRYATGAGILLATVGVAAFLVAVPPSALAGPGSVPTPVLMTYGAGVLLALWSPIVAAGLAAGQGRAARPSTAPTFVRSPGSVRSGGRVPADGGREEERLAFLLDNDDE